jgi:hypothetical protein
LPVDNEDCRRAPDAVHIPVLVEQHRRDVPALLDGPPDLVGIFPDVDEEDFEPLTAKVLVDLLDGG